MRFAASLRHAALAFAVVGAALCLQIGQASAQILWDWGGKEDVDGSGREVVRFNPQYPEGQIIVSFGDRRLYFVTRPGEAISYPIAIPREEDRWEGATTVTEKRENPSWTPTPTMVAENPRLPRWVPGGHPMNPLGVRALYLGSSMYRIHGTDAPLDHRHGGLQGLHPPVQSGCARSVSARRQGGPGARDLGQVRHVRPLDPDLGARVATPAPRDVPVGSAAVLSDDRRVPPSRTTPG